MKEKIEQLMDKYNYDELEMEGAINFVADLLELQTEYLKEAQPDAFTSIERINQAITEVNSLLWLNDAFEEE